MLLVVSTKEAVPITSLATSDAVTCRVTLPSFNPDVLRLILCVAVFETVKFALIGVPPPAEDAV